MSGITVTKTYLHIGAKKPTRLLHITDSHVCRAYESEGEKLVNLAKKRADRCFGGEDNIEKYFEEAVRYGKKNDDLIVYTGDIYDFISQSNFDYMAKALKLKNYIYAAGNHDFCTAPGADKEDYEFKMRQLKIVSPYIKSNLLFDSRLINGINLVTMDNSYYQFTTGQLDMLKAEAAKGYPILLFIHNPFYSKEIAEDKMSKGDCAYVVCPPEELLTRYPKDRADYQRATDETNDTLRFILDCEEIQAIFAGHLHENYENRIFEKKMQYVTAGTFTSDAREIFID
ncbi:MAG: metallophosphoesterase [Clostridiales bacterium]|nr:metallophosphoesterase [Clostridiales bacterium]